MLKKRTARSLRRRSRKRNRVNSPEALEDRSLLSTITVTSLADNEDADGQVTLREAITAANEDISVDGSEAGDGADVIRFASGLSGTINLSTELEVLSLTQAVTIRGNGANSTVIDSADANKALKVLTLEAVALRDFSVQNAPIAISLVHKKSVVDITGVEFLDNGTGIDGVGTQLIIDDSRFIGNTDRGIDSSVSRLVVRGSEFRANVARTEDRRGGNIGWGHTVGGGAIRHRQGELVVRDSTFIENTARNGGAIYTTSGDVLVRDSHFESNLAEHTRNAHGGAIRTLARAGSMEIRDSTFLRNTASGDNAIGGALSTSGSASILRTTFKQNAADGRVAEGGAIQHIGELAVVESSLTGNRLDAGATRREGAGINHDSGNLEVSRSLLSNNKRGAAIRSQVSRSQDEPDGRILIDSTTISGNGFDTKTSQATAVYAVANVIEVNASTIVDNIREDGRASVVLAGDSISIVSSVIANGGARDVQLGPGSVSISHSLISTNSGTSLPASPSGVADANGNLIGSADQPIDPKLGPLANNGGRSRTHLPKPDSPVLDRGLPTGSTVDQRGTDFPRFAGDAVDMGAAEVFDHAFQISPTSIIEGDSHNEVTFDVTLLGDIDIPLSVSYETADGSAIASEDYRATSGDLVFLARGQSQSIVVLIYGDTTVEANEDFQLRLRSGTARVGVAGEVVIENDDRGVGISGRELLLLGDDADDVASIELLNDQYIAKLNGETVVANVAEIDRVRFEAMTGNNKLNVQPEVAAPVIVTSGSGNDTIRTGGGDDTVRSGGGNDVLLTRDGHDVIETGFGADTIDGGAGADHIQAGPGADDIKSREGADTVEGGQGSDLIAGGHDNDLLSGGDGNDRILGGFGNDTIRGGSGRDRMEGNAGDDEIGYYDYRSSRETLLGGSGNDRMFASSPRAFFSGGSGNDRINADGDLSTVYGGSGADYIQFDDSTVWGGAGNDELEAWSRDGDAVAYGEGGDDIMRTKPLLERGRVRFFGGDGDDQLYGAGGHDLLNGGPGDDTVRGGDGTDTLLGGVGDDDLAAGSGDDIVRGNSGNDRVAGGSDNDVLDGGEGDDTLLGGEGRDVLVAGVGSDQAIGAAGEDILIAGSTTLTTQQLDAVRNEWTSDRTQSEREANLRDGSGTTERLNGTAFLDVGVTIFDDDSRDEMLGGDDADWFFANIRPDVLDDRDRSELFDRVR